jgi:putative flippase GtrA
MENSQGVTLTKRDYFLVGFIGVAFALFAIPILNNIKLSFFDVNIINILILAIVLAVFANLALWIAAIIGKKIPIVFQFAKFAAVGAFNTFLDWGILNLLIALTGTAAGIGYTIFKGISFIVANVSSYMWNKYWTFGSQEKASAQEFGRFFGVSIVGMIINMAIASIVVNVIGPQGGMSPEQWANVGALAATVASLGWNFVGYKLWVFKK